MGVKKYLFGVRLGAIGFGAAWWIAGLVDDVDDVDGAKAFATDFTDFTDEELQVRAVADAGLAPRTLPFLARFDRSLAHLGFLTLNNFD
jgi:hypothetical protein